MCLAVPGKIVALFGEDALLREGDVSFGGVVKRVSLAYVPEAQVGDYAIVHAGFAIALLDEEAAAASLREIRALDRSLDQAFD